jgi:hypothetical protein
MQSRREDHHANPVLSPRTGGRVERSGRVQAGEIALAKPSKARLHDAEGSRYDN